MGDSATAGVDVAVGVLLFFFLIKCHGQKNRIMVAGI